MINRLNGWGGERDKSAQAKLKGQESAVQACYLLLAGEFASARAHALRAIYLLAVAKSPDGHQKGPGAP